LGNLVLFWKMKIEEARGFLVELAEASAREILPHFGRKGVGVDTKSDLSPVTVADREAERVMREMIGQRFPEHGIVGEEFGTLRGDAEFVWVLDPIDGTKSFISAIPLFGTLIGLMHRGRPVLGCIHQPVLRQLMIGDGEVTTLNGEPVRGRSCASLSDATLLMSDPMHPAVYQDGAKFEALCRRARVVRSWGDCYGYLLVAAGWADVMVDPIMNPWDLQPIVPIIRGAGGVITDWNGGSADGLAAASGIAAMPGIHAEVVRALNGGPG
jgi:histidinol phosphatase-like enzyme (inositol monophosphatase family)